MTGKTFIANEDYLVRDPDGNVKIDKGTKIGVVQESENHIHFWGDIEGALRKDIFSEAFTEVPNK